MENKNDSFIKVKNIVDGFTKNKKEQIDVLKDIFQIQSDKNTDYAYIVKVGKFNKIPSIVINRFDYGENFHCLLLSCFFDSSSLVQNCYKLNMFKLVINVKKDQNLFPIGCIITSLNRKKGSENVLSSISDNKDDKKKIEGNFSIDFIFENDKKISLDTYDMFIGFEKLTEKMIMFLESNKINSILHNKSLELLN